MHKRSGSEPSDEEIPGIWRSEDVKHFLKDPEAFVQQPHQIWIQRQGGLEAALAFLRGTQLAPNERKLLDLLLNKGNEEALWYADQLGVSRPTYYDRLNKLAGVLTQHFNAWRPEETQRPSPPPGATLPTPTTPLIGRSAEVQKALAALQRPDVRMLTLVGPGGVGKTHLGLEIMGKLSHAYVDGAYNVGLERISDATQVGVLIAQALGVLEVGQPQSERLIELGAVSLEEHLKEYVRDRHILLFLDNFEQVMEAAPLVSGLLSAARLLTIMATSREWLRVSGEQVLAVNPLDAPARGASVSVEQIGAYPAIGLFEHLARAAKDDFALTNENLPAVAEICRRLDGLPLAIELAAPWITMYTPDQLLVELSNQLRLQAPHGRGRAERQLSLEATFDWSYRLLQPHEQALLARLAVFVGGCPFKACETVCVAEDGGTTDVRSTVRALLDKNLLREEQEADGTIRLIMLETIRGCALKLLETRGEADIVRQRHAGYYLALAQEAELILVGNQQRVWLARLELEHDNLRAALNWALARDVEVGVQIGGALGRFWYLHGHWSEGRTWLNALVTAGSATTRAARAPALSWHGFLIWRQDRTYARAMEVLEQSRTLYEALEDKAGLATSYRRMGIIALEQGADERGLQLLEQSKALYEELDDKLWLADIFRHMGMARINLKDTTRAVQLLERSLALCKELGNDWWSARSLRSLGEVLRDQGDYPRAAALIEQSLALFREFGETSQIAWACHDLGELAQLAGDDEQAQSWYAQSLPLFETLGAKVGRAWSQHNAGYLARHRGDDEEARRCFLESLRLFEEIGVQDGIGDCLAAWAGIIANEHPEKAARLLGAAEALHAGNGTQMRPIAQAEFDAIVTAVGAQLGEAAFTAAQAAGQALSLEEKIAAIAGKRSRHIGEKN